MPPLFEISIAAFAIGVTSNPAMQNPPPPKTEVIVQQPADDAAVAAAKPADATKDNRDCAADSSKVDAPCSPLITAAQ